LLLFNDKTECEYIYIHVWLGCFFAVDTHRYWREQKVIREAEYIYILKKKKEERTNANYLSIKNDANLYKYIQNKKKKTSQLIRLINHLWHRICYCLFGSMSPYISRCIPIEWHKNEYLRTTRFYLCVSFHVFLSFFFSFDISNWCDDSAFCCNRYCYYQIINHKMSKEKEKKQNKPRWNLEISIFIFSLEIFWQKKKKKKIE